MIINPDKGDFEIWKNRTVVEDGAVSNPNLEVSLSEAKKTVDDIEVGEDFIEEVFFEKFGRRAILNLRQTLASKILELQKDCLYNKYSEMVGQVVSAEVYQIWKKEMLLVDDEENELLLPKTEQIPSDFYRKGDTVRAVVSRVDNKNNNPKIMLSRTEPLFLQRLFELEVPEIAEGIIRIVKIARIPGERAKIAVETSDDRIDPVGACVGVKGARIHGIVRELRNENIDVINFTENVSLFVQRALSPAEVSSIRVNEANKTAEVFLRPDQVSLAIGKGGMNIKLACMLTGYTIDVYRDIDEANEEDIYLDEFSDEIEPWVIEALKSIGCATAKSVLNTSREILIEKADLEENTVDEIMRILSNEFDGTDGDEAMENVAPVAEAAAEQEAVQAEAEAHAEPVMSEAPAQSVDDVYIEEFKDVIEEWVIEAIKSVGLETARAVLAADPVELADKADLEEETVEDVMRILKEEME